MRKFVQSQIRQKQLQKSKSLLIKVETQFAFFIIVVYFGVAFYRASAH